MLKKLYRLPGPIRWTILEKEVAVSDVEAIRWIDNLYG